MNKYKLALELIKESFAQGEFQYNNKETHIIEELVEKETPKKVDDTTYGMFKCPICKNPFLDRRENYCCDCGQKLDWGK